MKNLSERILALREAKGLKQSEMSRMLGISQAKLSLLEKGENKPLIDFYNQVLDAFPNISLDWLVKGEGQMFSFDVPTEAPIGLPRKKNTPLKDDTWVEKLIARLESQINEAKIREEYLMKQNQMLMEK